jgi:hypothetical protein
MDMTCNPNFLATANIDADPQTARSVTISLPAPPDASAAFISSHYPDVAKSYGELIGSFKAI